MKEIAEGILRGDKHKYKLQIDFCMWTNRRCIEESWKLDETIPPEKRHNPPFDCRDCVQRKKAPNFKEREAKPT